MKVLVACEFSGVVRNAFTAKGHYAVSCDLLPTESAGEHYQGDLFDILGNLWDLVIAHPPCTALCVSGNRYYADSSARLEAIQFVERIWAYRSNFKLCIENPIGVLSTQSTLKKPTQYIQPYEYGHAESKKTCFWLSGLPKLSPSNVLPKPTKGFWDNQTPSGQNKLGPSDHRAMDRSRTYQGIAQAMADQWG